MRGKKKVANLKVAAATAEQVQGSGGGVPGSPSLAGGGVPGLSGGGVPGIPKLGGGGVPGRPIDRLSGGGVPG
jgi:hypothetical protein